GGWLSDSGPGDDEICPGRREIFGSNRRQGAKVPGLNIFLQVRRRRAGQARDSFQVPTEPEERSVSLAGSTRQRGGDRRLDGRVHDRIFYLASIYMPCMQCTSAPSCTSCTSAPGGDGSSGVWQQADGYRIDEWNVITQGHDPGVADAG